MKQINPQELKNDNFFTVRPDVKSVFHKNGDRSYNAKIFKFLERKHLNPEKTIIFAQAFEYKFDDKLKKLVLKEYDLFMDGRSYVVDFEQDEWVFFEYLSD